MGGFNDVLPIIIVIVFWMVLFVFAFWFSTRALLAPTEAEHSTEAEESGSEAVSTAH